MSYQKNVGKRLSILKVDAVLSTVVCVIPAWQARRRGQHFLEGVQDTWTCFCVGTVECALTRVVGAKRYIFFAMNAYARSV